MDHKSFFYLTTMSDEYNFKEDLDEMEVRKDSDFEKSKLDNFGVLQGKSSQT